MSLALSGYPGQGPSLVAAESLRSSARLVSFHMAWYVCLREFELHALGLDSQILWFGSPPRVTPSWAWESALEQL